MKKQLILLFTLIFTGIFSAAAQDPIYVVNGQVVSDIRNIPPGDIESTESCLPTSRPSPDTEQKPRTA